MIFINHHLQPVYNIIVHYSNILENFLEIKLNKLVNLAQWPLNVVTKVRIPVSSLNVRY